VNNRCEITSYGELVGLGALAQRLLDLVGLRIRELGRSASGLAAPRRRHPALGEQGLPAPHALGRGPTAAATSAWERPWANNSAARSRRASAASGRFTASTGRER
jgi:hypothetical protein